MPNRVHQFLRAIPPVAHGQVLFRGDAASPGVALTVDDGPSVHTTPALLDVLGSHGARATFFVLGERAERHPDLVERIVRDGHELGNHTWADEPSSELTPDDFAATLAATQRLLTRHADVRWFRPGSGWFSETMIEQVEDAGLRCVLGSMTAVRHGGAGDEHTARWIGHLARRGTIVVLHEGTRERQRVVATVDALLRITAGRDLAAVTLSELVG